MTQQRRVLSPLNQADLERLALRYVERYATTRGRLATYLRRKIRERGWYGEAAADPVALAERMAELRYVDDRAFAEMRAGSMGRRGLGARRIEQALRFDGIDEQDRSAVSSMLEEEATTSALAFARRKRIGPYAREQADRAVQQKHLAAMLRAGHGMDVARAIVRMAPGEDEGALEAAFADD
jgi:regulatory protein